MESDFSIRNHLDSINLSNDPSVFELLNRYKEEPSSTSSNRSTLGNSEPVSRLPEKKDVDGLSLSVGPDVVRWVVLLVVVLILVWLLQRNKKSKLTKRMKKIEKELIRLRRIPEEPK